MSSTIEKKTISNCDCPRSKTNRDVIVITIETCCKRSCDSTEKGETKSQDESTKAEASKVNFAEGDGDSDAVVSDPSSVEVDPASGGSAADISRSASRLTTADPSRSASRLTTADPSRSASRLTTADPAKSESRIATRTVSQSATGSVHSEHDVTIEDRALFKLPLLVGRHHGPGCAMEISVLEKHDGTCVYKKEDADGRSIDDRTGSYECIGRMVFRTCNANELESDSSGSQGIKPGQGAGHGGASTTALPKHPVEHKPSPPTPQVSPPPSRAQSVMSTPDRRQPSTMSTPSVHTSGKSQQSGLRSSPASTHSAYGSAKSQIIEEDAFTKTSHEPVESARRRRNVSNNQQIMMVDMQSFPDASDFRGTPRHFHGDDCKLHGPRAPLMLPKSPLLLPSGQFDKIYSSKKNFPRLSDGSNQTETHVGDDVSNKSRLSLETISSLTDLSKQAVNKKKASWGSWFRKGSLNTEAKKFKK